MQASPQRISPRSDSAGGHLLAGYRQPVTAKAARGPLIGIVSHQAPVREPSGPVTHHVTDSAYIKAVRKAGGVPILLPLVEETDAEELVGLVDGVLLTGGDDVDPARYGQPTAPETEKTDPERDARDVAACLAALDAGRPLLVVCRGAQVLNVALGGTLVQHVESHRHVEGYNRAVHDVAVTEASALSEWLGEQTPTSSPSLLGVNSLHHQSIGDPGRGVQVVGRAPDGVIEAITIDGRPDVLGVQWHPEWMRHLPQQLALFTHLVQLAATAPT